jgi:septal ring factor EnvC (AmiA/AmiB activator)
MILWLLACGGPSAPGPAPEGSASAASLAHLLEAGEDARDVQASSARMQALLEELRNRDRDQDEVLQDLQQELARAREAASQLNGHLDEAESSLAP